MLAFGGSRTFHRITCAIEDAGFEIRDTIMWLYGSGFPKSMNVGLAIDKKNGVESKVIGTQIKETQNKWKGWGTCLKPAFEPIIVARKPFKGSLVDNVIEWGVGGINIDECRVITGEKILQNTNIQLNENKSNPQEYRQKKMVTELKQIGRFPANLILTYNQVTFDEVCGGFPNTNGSKGNTSNKGTFWNSNNENIRYKGYSDSGSASRYFYCAKASKKDRDEGLEEFKEKNTMCDRNPELASANMPQNRSGNLRKNTHPTVKPTELMQYLVRLVSPKGATILDPFMGSGSTGKAVMYENKERQANYKFIGIEKEKEYCDIAEARINFVLNK